MRDTQNPEEHQPSYIVGIGGSAGGLEAFEMFLEHTPPDTGMAFVVVQHLDPTRKGMLPELLQRATKMPVLQIEDGMVAQPNHIYVIPPNNDVSILHGVLHLMEPVAPRGLRLPIDVFFEYLADDQREQAVGVILSGMGTDGSQGLRAIKEKMGLVMVQDPEDAKFDGMPQSAVATGLADFVVPVEQIPGKLIEFTKHILSKPKGNVALTERATNTFQKILILLRAKTGQDFSLYKKDTVLRRIKRRMSVHLIDSIEHYAQYLQENPTEVELLFKELLIGVTKFFRDAPAFEALKEQVVSRLLQGNKDRTVLRAWVVGCSTGEEAYSIAIILREAFDTLQEQSGIEVQVFATDIDKDAIEIARRGIYDSNIAPDVSPERLQRFFVMENEKFRLKKEIRDMLVFAPHNVIMDPPFTKMDLVSCRNLLIYFSPELQKKVLPIFHYSLNPGGILFLGTSETIGGSGEFFSTLVGKWKVFQRRDVARLPGLIEFPSSRQIPKAASVPVTASGDGKGVQVLAEKALLESYTPPAVLTNESGDILYISGRTGKYLEPSPGKANMNVYAMAREGLRHELGMAIRKAVMEKTDITLKNLTVKMNGHEETINLTVRPVNQPGGAANLLLIAFEEVKSLPRRRSLGKAAPSGGEHDSIQIELQEELRYTKERLRDTIEQMQSSQEELQSTNEELQSANEELQSTNEELMTSKEEMQSLNEELTTVNAELQSKLDQLSRSNNDLANLLNSTEIATIFLDNDLNIRRFTAAATKIIKMIDSDVGRPITDLVSNLKYDNLSDDARQVLKTLVFKEIQVETSEERWYTLRIMPYRTVDNVIDGVVVLFTDISELKHLEQSLRDERNYARSIIATVREPLLILDSSLRVVSASRSFYQMFRAIPEDTEGYLLSGVIKGQFNIPALTERLEAVFPGEVEFTDFAAELEIPGEGRRNVKLSARRIHREAGATPLILLSIENTERLESGEEISKK